MTRVSEEAHTITLRKCGNLPPCPVPSTPASVRHQPQQPQQPPNVQITFPPPGSVICGTVTVRATAASPAGIHDVTFAYSLDGGATWVDIGTDTSGPPYTVLFDTTTVPDGPIQIRAVATDNNGRTATDIRSYVVDNTPPVVTITSPPNNSVVSGTITVTGTATDTNLAFVEWLVDGTVVATQTTPPFALTLDTTTLSEGPHTVTLRACDPCPNCAETSITIIVRNAPQPPTVVITAPPNGSVICGTVTISADASSPAGIHDVAFAYSINQGATWVPIGTDTSGPPYTVSFDTTLVPNGPIRIRAVATANDGLTATAVNDYTVDNTPPMVTIDSPASGSTVSGTITVTGTATDIDLAFVEWLVDGTVVATQTTPPFALTLGTTALADGPHTVTLRACDLCQHCAAASITIIVRNGPAPFETQVGLDDAICIPAPKPPAEEIVTHRVEITADRVYVIGSPLGTKVVVIGQVCVLLTYSADVREQTVHAVEACFPFHTFILAPGLAPGAHVTVSTELEFAEFKLLDPCTIGKFLLFRVTATPF